MTHTVILEVYSLEYKDLRQFKAKLEAATSIKLGNIRKCLGGGFKTVSKLTTPNNDNFLPKKKES